MRSAMDGRDNFQHFRAEAEAAADRLVIVEGNASSIGLLGHSQNGGI